MLFYTSKQLHTKQFLLHLDSICNNFNCFNSFSSIFKNKMKSYTMYLDCKGHLVVLSRAIIFLGVSCSIQNILREINISMLNCH